MIWMYCPKCGAPMRSVTTGWICTELGCGCKLDVYGNQYTDTTYNVDYWYEVDEKSKGGSSVDVEEVKAKEKPEVKIAEVVEDISGTREDPAELVRLMNDLFYNDGGPWYR